MFPLGGVDGVLGRVGCEVVQGREGSGLDVSRHFRWRAPRQKIGWYRGVCGTWGSSAQRSLESVSWFGVP